jgi:D-alanyl-D-alanine carboxypeptidase (penicillin-binding protein 5/6)
MTEFKKWYFRIYLFFVRILIVSMIIGISFPVHVFGTTELKQLYALSAVLMDADSGRILFSKNGQEERAMASTTKIMTLIVTLEHADLNDVVTFSDYAASQPDVQLNGASGEQFLLKDLCFSLMLESHNDSAVAIAEYVAGTFL